MIANELAFTQFSNELVERFLVKITHRSNYIFLNCPKNINIKGLLEIIVYRWRFQVFRGSAQSKSKTVLFFFSSHYTQNLFLEIDSIIPELILENIVYKYFPNNKNISSKNSNLKEPFNSSFNLDEMISRSCMFDINLLLHKNKIKVVDTCTDYFFKDIENACTGPNILKGSYQLTQLSSFQGVTYKVLWTQMIEEALGISLPERGKAYRTIYLEIERIQEHIFKLADFFNYLNHHSLIDLFYSSLLSCDEFLSCLNQDGELILLGGSTPIVGEHWRFELFELCNTLTERMQQFEKKLNSSLELRETLLSVKPQTDITSFVSGPLAKSMGCYYDLRKIAPYLLYSQLDFQIPLGVHGSIFEILYVRVQEIYQSINLIKHLAYNFPAGQAVSSDCVSDIRNKLKTRLQSFLLGELKIPDGIKHSSIEAANGSHDLICFFENNKIVDVKLFTADRYQMSALTDLLSGMSIEQAALFYASLSLNCHEVIL